MYFVLPVPPGGGRFNGPMIVSDEDDRVDGGAEGILDFEVRIPVGFLSEFRDASPIPELFAG